MAGVAGLAKRFRGSQRFAWSRSLKYATLVFLAALHLLYIIILFSNYTVRRELEADIGKLGADESLDSLMLIASTGGDRVRKINEYRCLQRDAITLFRLATMNLRKDMSELYGKTLRLRSAVRDFVQKEPLLDRDLTLRRLDDVWGVPVAGDLVFVATAPWEKKQEVIERFVAELDAQFKTMSATPAFEQVAKLLGVEHNMITSVAQLRSASGGAQRFDTAFFNLTAIGALESALAKMKAEMKTAGLQDPKRVNLLIRKLSADSSVQRGDVEASYLSEIASQLDSTGQSPQALQDLDCDKVDSRLKQTLVAFATAAAGRPCTQAADQQQPAARCLNDEPRTQRRGSYAARAVAFVQEDVHGTLIQKFIKFPTSAQTFIVTMLFGSLGALCLQALRLSNRGYWDAVAAPAWGEIVISMWLGMAAAMIVYLLASMGQLLVSDARGGAGATTVGASLVALLGFVSGLLNDEAFGRIRRFGQQLFQETPPGDQPTTGLDAELAQRLRDAKCERFAELVRVHRAGSSLAQRSAFTLFAPDDDAFAPIALTTWLALTNPKQPRAFNEFLSRHLVEGQKLTMADLGKASELKMADGTTAKVSQAAGTTSLDGIGVRSAPEIAWREGAIVVLVGLRPVPAEPPAPVT